MLLTVLIVAHHSQTTPYLQLIYIDTEHDIETSGMLIFLRKNQVAARIGYSQSHLMRLVRQGRFPKPIRLSATIPAWPENEVEAWQQARIDERDRSLHPDAKV